MVAPVLPIVSPVGIGSGSSTMQAASALAAWGHQNSYYGEDDRKVLSAKNLLAELYAIRVPSVSASPFFTNMKRFSATSGQQPVTSAAKEESMPNSADPRAESLQSHYDGIPSKYLVLNAANQIRRFFGAGGESADAKRCLHEIVGVLQRREAKDEYKQVENMVSEVALRRGGEELLQIFSQRGAQEAVAATSPSQGQGASAKGHNGPTSYVAPTSHGAPDSPSATPSGSSSGSTAKASQGGGIVIAPEIPKRHEELEKPYVNIPPTIKTDQPVFPAGPVKGVEHTGGSAIPDRSLTDGKMISPPPVAPDKGDNVYRDQEFGLSIVGPVSSGMSKGISKDRRQQPQSPMGDQGKLNIGVLDAPGIGDFPPDFHSPTVVYGDVQQKLGKFVNGLEGGQGVVILPHINPDNDAIAALVAAKESLEELSGGRNKITAYVPIEGTNPKLLEWLRAAGEENLGLKIAPTADILQEIQGNQGAAVVVVDTADQGNTIAKGLELPKITAIDHHSMTGSQVIADAAVYPLPALSLATGQHLAASYLPGDGYRKVAVLAGVITDTCTDMFLARNPELSSAMLEGASGASVLLKNPASDSGVGGYWRNKVGERPSIELGRVDSEGMMPADYFPAKGGHPSYLDAPLSFASLVKLHKGLNDGTIDGSILKDDLAHSIKSDPTLAYLAAPSSKELVSTIDALYSGMRYSGTDAVNFFKQHIDRTFSSLDAMTAASRHRVHGSGESAFDEYDMPDGDRRFSSSLGLLSFASFDGANPGRPVVAISSMNDKLDQASVLLSGPHSIEQAALLSRLVSDNNMAGGHTMPIYGPVNIIRFGAKFPSEKLGVFREIVSQVAQLGAEQRERAF